MLAGAILFNQQVADELSASTPPTCSASTCSSCRALTPGDLARCCGLTTGGVTVVLDRLEKAGYIRREANPRDRRSLLIRPVPAKMRKLHNIYRSKSQSLAEVKPSYIIRDLTFCKKASVYPGGGWLCATENISETSARSSD